MKKKVSNTVRFNSVPVGEAPAKEGEQKTIKAPIFKCVYYEWSFNTDHFTSVINNNIPEITPSAPAQHLNSIGPNNFELI